MDSLELRNELEDAVRPVLERLEDLSGAEGWSYQVHAWAQNGTWQGIRGPDGIEKMLTEYGINNWELVAVVPSELAMLYIFKRPGAQESES